MTTWWKEIFIFVTWFAIKICINASINNSHRSIKKRDSVSLFTITAGIRRQFCVWHCKFNTWVQLIDYIKKLVEFFSWACKNHEVVIKESFEKHDWINSFPKFCCTFQDEFVNLAMNMSARFGATRVPIGQPISCWNSCSSNSKIFHLWTKSRSLTRNWFGTSGLSRFSRASLTASSPSDLVMFVYNAVASIVTRMALGGILSRILILYFHYNYISKKIQSIKILSLDSNHFLAFQVVEC